MWYCIRATCLRGGRIWDRSSNSYDATRGIFSFCRCGRQCADQGEGKCFQAGFLWRLQYTRHPTRFRVLAKKIEEYWNFVEETCSLLVLFQFLKMTQTCTESTGMQKKAGDWARAQNPLALIHKKKLQPRTRDHVARKHQNRLSVDHKMYD